MGLGSEAKMSRLKLKIIFSGRGNKSFSSGPMEVEGMQSEEEGIGNRTTTFGSLY